VLTIRGDAGSKSPSGKLIRRTVSATCDNPLRFLHCPHTTPSRGYYSPAAWESLRASHARHARVTADGEARYAADQGALAGVARSWRARVACVLCGRARAANRRVTGAAGTGRRAAAAACGATPGARAARSTRVRLPMPVKPATPPIRGARSREPRAPRSRARPANRRAAGAAASSAAARRRRRSGSGRAGGARNTCPSR